MGALFSVLGAFTTIYTILIFLRIMLTWFSGAAGGSAVRILGRATDPYLNWFRRFPVLRSASIDFSPIAALAVLSIAGSIFHTLAVYGRISLGIILSIVLSAVWAALSFMLIFFMIVLILRLFSYAMGRNSFLPIWNIVNALSAPVLYRINRLVYRDRLVSYRTGILTAVLVLLAARIGLGLAVGALSRLLIQLPF